MKGSWVSVLVCAALLLAGARSVECRPQEGASASADGGAVAGQTQAPPSAASQTSPTPALSRQAEKIRRVVERVGVGNKITVVLKGGMKYHGSVREFGAGEFKLVEVDLQRIMTFRYEDVEKARSNYGERNAYGRRVDPKKSVLLGAALLGGLFLLVALSIPKT